MKRLLTFVKIPNSRHDDSNTSWRFSPEWGPESSRKSINVEWRFHSESIQWPVIPKKKIRSKQPESTNHSDPTILIPKNGCWFLEVHASKVNEIFPGISWSTLRILSCSFMNIANMASRTVSADGTSAPWLSICRRDRISVPSTTVKGWSSQIIYWMSFFRKFSGLKGWTNIRTIFAYKKMNKLTSTSPPFKKMSIVPTAPFFYFAGWVDCKWRMRLPVLPLDAT